LAGGEHASAHGSAVAAARSSTLGGHVVPSEHASLGGRPRAPGERGSRAELAGSASRTRRTTRERCRVRRPSSPARARAVMARARPDVAPIGAFSRRSGLSCLPGSGLVERDQEFGVAIGEPARAGPLGEQIVPVTPCRVELLRRRPRVRCSMLVRGPDHVDVPGAPHQSPDHVPGQPAAPGPRRSPPVLARQGSVPSIVMGGPEGLPSCRPRSPGRLFRGLSLAGRRRCVGDAHRLHGTAVRRPDARAGGVMMSTARPNRRTVRAYCRWPLTTGSHEMSAPTA